MVKITISGVCGRMGKRIALLATKDKDFKIISGLEFPGSQMIGKDIGEILSVGHLGANVESDFSKASQDSEVLIEFTSPEVTMKHLEEARKKKIGVVIGTTAVSEKEMGKIKTISKEIPIVFSPNMSIGANLLFNLTEEVASTLGDDYEVEIVEAHHSQKKDAPSGTAKKLGERVAKARGKVPPIQSIREGDIVGDHTVIFAGKTERIELTHRAHSRDVFAKGALEAARFLKGKKPALYTMHDVIKG